MNGNVPPTVIVASFIVHLPEITDLPPPQDLIHINIDLIIINGNFNKELEGSKIHHTNISIFQSR